MVNDEQSEEEEKDDKEGLKRNSNWDWHVEVFAVFTAACRYIHTWVLDKRAIKEKNNKVDHLWW